MLFNLALLTNGDSAEGASKLLCGVGFTLRVLRI
jgi:hypothetical protein